MILQNHKEIWDFQMTRIQFDLWLGLILFSETFILNRLFTCTRILWPCRHIIKPINPTETHIGIKGKLNIVACLIFSHNFMTSLKCKIVLVLQKWNFWEWVIRFCRKNYLINQATSDKHEPDYADFFTKCNIFRFV